LPTKFVRTVLQGQSVRHVTAGGGGAGDPWTRDPHAVLDDVRDGRVSIDAARTQYGVIVEPRPWRIDAAQTTALRAAHQTTPPVTPS
jgi:N-methylhydantoinase B